MKNARLIEIKSNMTPDRGRLTVVEDKPFKIERAFWIDGMLPDTRRGGHAHKELSQLLICVSGSCKVYAYKPDGSKQFFRLVSPNVGLYVPPLTWLDIFESERKTVLLVLADDVYKENDYIRSTQEFEAYA